jgi:hypothetical protein
MEKLFYPNGLGMSCAEHRITTGSCSRVDSYLLRFLSSRSKNNLRLTAQHGQ